ncbi:transglutaminase family protein [Parvibaculum sp.]|uniref:transglutaminase family protein n=1 Tax=Parvibaculum sp. TaxID=2024848 RepID=UPI000C8D6AB5|nr:transglutaminase family protein [Parvibaculum sp.]MAB15301.1 transglutaminase [Parvibaculum sp.]
MRIHLQHETTYRYEFEASYALQALRLTPLDNGNQKILDWRIGTPWGATMTYGRDAYGNVLNMLTLDRAHTELTLTLTGEVETKDANGVLSGVPEYFPPLFYLRETELTEPDEAIEALAQAAKKGSDGSPLDLGHQLMGAVRDAIDYQTGLTDVTTKAGEALAAGNGVCQDHAHVFISAARVLGVPARYVSGYLWGGEGEAYEASHAWAEAYIDGLGWVGFDVANRLCPTDAHIRVASGLDYFEAAPVRGVRRGGGNETLEVRLVVDDKVIQQ